jgi:hypothetical protein
MSTYSFIVSRDKPGGSVRRVRRRGQVQTIRLLSKGRQGVILTVDGKTGVLVFIVNGTDPIRDEGFVGLRGHQINRSRLQCYFIFSLSVYGQNSCFAVNGKNDPLTAL